MSGQAAVLAAIRARLAADPGVLALLPADRIHDRTPPNPAHPYAAFGDVSSTARDAASHAGEEHVIDLDIWSSRAGRAEALAIADAMVGALQAEPPTPVGQTMIVFDTLALTTAIADDGRAARAKLRFRAITETPTA